LTSVSDKRVKGFRFEQTTAEQLGLAKELRIRIFESIAAHLNLERVSYHLSTHLTQNATINIRT